MSGIMTRDQLVAEICDTVGKQTGATSVSGQPLSTRAQTFLNWGQKRIARFHSFYELDTLLTTAVTVANVKLYPMVTGTNNLGMLRPKDIHSIRLIDGTNANSRRLKRWSYKKMDMKIPDPTTYTTGRPIVYVRYGMSLEFFRIPDTAYSLSIRYPQWPTDFSTASQVSDYTDKDHILVTAGIMETYLALEEYTDAAVWYQRLMGLLIDAKRTEDDNVDWDPDGEPFRSDEQVQVGQPWSDPAGTPEDPLYGYSN